MAVRWCRRERCGAGVVVCCVLLLIQMGCGDQHLSQKVFTQGVADVKSSETGVVDSHSSDWVTFGKEVINKGSHGSRGFLSCVFEPSSLEGLASGGSFVLHAKVSNTSKSQCSFDDLKTSCACALPASLPEIIASGGSDRIPVVVKPTNVGTSRVTIVASANVPQGGDAAAAHLLVKCNCVASAIPKTIAYKSGGAVDLTLKSSHKGWVLKKHYLSSHREVSFDATIKQQQELRGKVRFNFQNTSVRDYETLFFFLENEGTGELSVLPVVVDCTDVSSSSELPVKWEAASESLSGELFDMRKGARRALSFAPNPELSLRNSLLLRRSKDCDGATVIQFLP